MIVVLILILIYLAFISLGLPDSILGAALPVMLNDSGLPMSAGSLLSMLIVGSTIISSFASGYIIKKIGTGKTVFISCLATGSALFGFSVLPGFGWLLLMAVPLGLGGGAVDTALNNYVALHYKARHMNWLHSFWGVGATLGPLIMSSALKRQNSWQAGYRYISFIQLGFAVLMGISLPLWIKRQKDLKESTDENKPVKNAPPWRLHGAVVSFIIMMLYCTVEASIGLWGSTFLVQVRDIDEALAARLIAFYFGGIMAGRFVSGFLSIKLNNKQMIRLGLLSVLAGILVLLLSNSALLTAVSVVFAGFGLAPVFPAMIHETPLRFGKDYSQILIGWQMGFAYIGSAFLSPGIGVILQCTKVSFFPFILLSVAFLLLLLTEKLNRTKTGKSP